MLARALAGRREQVVIATKFGNLFDEDTRQITGTNATPESIRQQCDESLRRLNTDYIDLYQFHLNDFPADQAAPVREALEKLVSAGKIRAYGWSTDFPDRARTFANGKRCAAIQVEMNVLDDAPDIIEVCEAENLAAINRGPLAMGLLTGKYTAATTLGIDDVRSERSPDWMKYFKDGKPNPEWLSRLDAVREILTSGGRTLAQGALGWLWARSDKTIPIPGFRTVAQVEENCRALDFGALTDAQMDEIDALLARETI